MAKKNQNQSENLLSQRMKKTERDDKKGRFGQQAEINIVVPESETAMPMPQQTTPQFSTGLINQPTQVQIPQNNVTENTVQVTDDISIETEAVTSKYTPTSQTNSFAQKIRKRQAQTEDTHPSKIHEFEFNADTESVFTYGDEDSSQEADTAPFATDSRFADMFRKRKTPKEKKTRTPKTDETTPLDGVNGNPFATKLPRWAKLTIIFSLIGLLLIVPQLVFRIPAMIGPSNEKTLHVFNDPDQKIITYIKGQCGSADFDNDGIPNSQDSHPLNPDVDQNGVSDGLSYQTFVNKGDILSYENITIEATDQTVGMSKFLNYYVFNNYKGWAKITNEDGIPYVHKNNGWTEAEYNKEGSTYYVKVETDCLIEFVPTDTVKAYATDLFGSKVFANVESRHVKDYGVFAPVTSWFLHALLPSTEPTDNTIASVWYTDTYHIIRQQNITKAEAVAPDMSKQNMGIFNTVKFSYEELYSAYKRINNRETVLISIVMPDGSTADAFVYAYDYLGNLYIADAQTSKTAGVIKITPRAQVYCENGQKYIREWFEFEGAGFSSGAGDLLIIC